MKREYLGVAMVAVVTAYGLLVYWASTAGTSLAWITLVTVSVALAVIVAIAFARREPRLSVSAADRAPNPGDGVYRMLIVVDGGGTSAPLRESLLELVAGRSAQALIIAPALSSRLDRLTGDQAAYDEAATRLHETIGTLDELGIEARGHIGSHDPLAAVDEGLREFPADRIVFATHAEDQLNWLENGVVEATSRRTGLPVTHVVVDRVSPG